jgi:thioredoxin-dependent peroxiredoxin
MTHLNIGDKAPNFSTVDELGNKIELKDFKGKKLIIYFYPKANTPGCTAESCNLRDFNEELKDKGFAIIGVSADNSKNQLKFKENYQLPFPLIPDTEKEMIKAFGAWGKKKLYGKEYDGIFRLTFVISEEGNIEKIFTKVNTKAHAEEILKAYD